MNREDEKKERNSATPLEHTTAEESAAESTAQETQAEEKTQAEVVEANEMQTEEAQETQTEEKTQASESTELEFEERGAEQSTAESTAQETQAEEDAELESEAKGAEHSTSEESEAHIAPILEKAKPKNKKRGTISRIGKLQGVYKGLIGLCALITLMAVLGLLSTGISWQNGFFESNEFDYRVRDIITKAGDVVESPLAYDPEKKEYYLPESYLQTNETIKVELDNNKQELIEKIEGAKIDKEQSDDSAQRFEAAKDLEKLEQRLLTLEERFLKEEEQRLQEQLLEQFKVLDSYNNVMIRIEKPESKVSYVNQTYKGQAIDEKSIAYGITLPQGSLEPREIQYGPLNKRQNAALVENRTRLSEVGEDYSIQLRVPNNPGYFLYKDDLSSAYDNYKEHILVQTSMLALIAGAGCVGMWLLWTMGLRRNQEGMAFESKAQSTLHEIQRVIGKIPMEFKLLSVVYLCLNVLNIFKYIYWQRYGLRNCIILIIVLILLALLMMDLIQTSWEDYVSNSIIKNRKRKKEKKPRRFSMLTKGIEKYFDRIMVVGALIVLSFFVSINSGSIEWFVFSALFGGLYILYNIYRLREEFLDEEWRYMDEIAQATQRIVDGNMGEQVVEKEGSPLAEFAHNINKMRHGYGTALEEQIKSERMKTELIANVSHDLKTPLTSIINYVDLLKKEELLPEYARDYVTILDQKSQRLNFLIEDLFEASRAASGDMKVKLERLNVGELLNQTLAELSGKIQNSGLDFIVNIPKETMEVRGDGSKLHRVFENLITNALKYSMVNSRVYIDLERKEQIVLTMKNMANYQMDFTQEEVVQRFVRGDRSRTTEGSGLGLAISQSLVDLMGMKMKIKTDGDLFKVEIQMQPMNA